MSGLLWGGRNTANKYHWRLWGVLSVFQLHWVCPHSQLVYFHGLHFSGSRLLCQELSEVSSGLRALPRSKPLRFRFSGTPQNAGPTECVPFWSTQEPEPEQLRPGKCTQLSAHLRQSPCRITWSLSSVDQESTHAVSGANPVWPRHCEHSPRTPVIFVCSVPPSPQHN